MVTSILAARPWYFLRSINFFMQPSGRHAVHDETHLRLHDSTRALPEATAIGMPGRCSVAESVQGRRSTDLYKPQIWNNMASCSTAVVAGHRFVGQQQSQTNEPVFWFLNHNERNTTTTTIILRVKAESTLASISNSPVDWWKCQVKKDGVTVGEVHKAMLLTNKKSMSNTREIMNYVCRLFSLYFQRSLELKLWIIYSDMGQASSKACCSLRQKSNSLV
jgi:hypothetical protein